MVSRLPAVLAVLALALLPAATAQLPAGGPMASVTVEVAKGPATIALGSEASVPVTVTFSLSNVVCPSPGSATVTLTYADEPTPMPGLEATLAPTALTFNLTAQQYASPGFSGSQTAKLSYVASRTARPDHDHAFNITATFDGALTGCQALPGTTVPSDSASAAHKVRTGPAAAGNGGNGTAGPTTEAQASPGPELPFIAFLGIAAAAMRRRRA